MFDSIGLTLNKNVIPNDARKPFDPSGVRLGTPAITTRGFKEKDMDMIAEWMYKAVMNKGDGPVINSLKNEVVEYCIKFPLPA